MIIVVRILGEIGKAVPLGDNFSLSFSSRLNPGQIALLMVMISLDMLTFRLVVVVCLNSLGKSYRYSTKGVTYIYTLQSSIHVCTVSWE